MKIKRLLALITALTIAISVVTSLSLVALAADEYSITEPESCEEHSFVNGFCTFCDFYEAPILVTSDNYTSLNLKEEHIGYYAIENAGQLYWFAALVDGTLNDGTEKTIYGTQTVTRSIYQVAAGLLKDETQTAYGLVDVLNAYANQTGIRLVVKGGELMANTSYTTNGAYRLTEEELHFEVSDAEYDKAGNKYSIVLTALGNAEIITDNDFWYDYIRINNNNSLIKDKVTVESVEGNSKAVKVTFAADGLIERPADKNDNTTPDNADDGFDGESEYN